MSFGRSLLHFFIFILRFWNQILTCLSVRFRSLATSYLRSRERYILNRNSFSSSRVWCLVYGQRFFLVDFACSQLDAGLFGSRSTFVSAGAFSSCDPLESASSGFFLSAWVVLLSVSATSNVCVVHSPLPTSGSSFISWCVSVDNPVKGRAGSGSNAQERTDAPSGSPVEHGWWMYGW